MNEPSRFLPFLITEKLYQIEDNPATSHEPTAPATEQTLSSATKIPTREILVLFDNASDINILASEKIYLSKILSAIGKSIENVEMQNVAQHSVQYSGYQTIVAFTARHQLPVALSTMPYTVTPMADTQLIIADSLTAIATSPQLRKQLWQVLQKIFL